MYESDEEYSFVVLSRVNSFKKVRWKFLKVLINGENPEVVVRMKIFNIYLNHKYFSSQIAINKINFSVSRLSFQNAQPASYGKKVSWHWKNKVQWN